MKVAIAQQMRNIDERAIRTIGIPGIALMEKAGSGVVEAACDYFGPFQGRKVVVLCGGGNNGGDGFVIARYAVNHGAEVEVLLLTQKEKIEGDARTNLDVLTKLGRSVKQVKGKADIRKALSGAYLIVDALLGSGLTGEVKGLYREAINEANDAGGIVVSVDNPSGIAMDTGAVLGSAVMADLTVTLGLPKRGHFLYPGREYCGELEVVDIGLPPEVIEDEGILVETLEEEDAERFLPDRKGESHKGDFGHLLVLAGSIGYTGAASLSAMSALKVGTGLVTLGIPRSLNLIMERKLTEVITRPLPETGTGSFSMEALDPMLELACGKDAVALGPGLSMGEETGELVRQFLTRCDRTVVLDADGINALIGYEDFLGKRKGPTVMTPHPGELGRLIGMSGREINDNRIEICVEFARKWNVVLVLKGAPTIVSDRGEISYINTTGNSGLATGGTGDVLTGAIGGFAAQGIDPFHAALCGTYYHGLAGDIAADLIGGRGMIAGDVMELLPEALRI
jgi:NAD(P)H-hydrate epimerase